MFGNHDLVIATFQGWLQIGKWIVVFKTAQRGNLPKKYTTILTTLRVPHFGKDDRNGLVTCPFQEPFNVSHGLETTLAAK